MKGDYFRYLCEFTQGDDRKKVIDNAQDSYKKASEEAEKLKTTHPIRLGLALNYSVFYYEILTSPDHACKLAKTAFDNFKDATGTDKTKYRKEFRKYSDAYYAGVTNGKYKEDKDFDKFLKKSLLTIDQ